MTSALAVLVVPVLLAGCMERFDLSTLPQQPAIVLDTSYVEIWPPFAGFAGAEDLLIGNDQLLYVADTRANRVVMMNRAGQFMSQRDMIQPVSLAQDSRLDLLVGARLVAGNGDTVAAVFRVHLVSASPDSAHRLELARVDTLWRELARPSRRFPGITVFSDNSYLVVRTGPDNSSFIDPDARVLLFDSHDRFVTPVPDLATGTGAGIIYINRPTSIVSFPGSRDFILAQSSEGVAYGGIWMVYQRGADFEGWTPRFQPGVDQVDFIRPNRFLRPEAVTIDRSRRDIFIADAGLDSIFKFNSRGVLKAESFGAGRTGGAMQQPSGLAYFERILYVLDRAQGIILRYRLSTDVPR